jgi:hypothetical protein
MDNQVTYLLFVSKNSTQAPTPTLTPNNPTFRSYSSGTNDPEVAANSADDIRLLR